MKKYFAEVWTFLKTKINFSRPFFYFLTFFVLLTIFAIIYVVHANSQEKLAVENQRQIISLNAISLLDRYDSLAKNIEEAKNKYPQIDLENEEDLLVELKSLILSRDYNNAKTRSSALLTQIRQKTATELTKGILSGKLTFSLPVDLTSTSATIKIFKGETQLTEISPNNDGTFSYWLLPEKYSLKINTPGYIEYTQDINIKTKETADLQIPIQIIPPIVIATPTPTATPKPIVVKPKTTPTPTPKPTTATSFTSDGIYSKENVVTDRGTFVVHLLRMDQSLYEMKIETASDSDCTNNCPVKSLSTYVTQDGGFAGIHGTYFCPTAYADCAGKTNSFYYKLYNSRLNTKINWSNGLGELLPFISLDNSGQAHYFDTWQKADGTDIKTGISCRPHLVENSEIVLTDADMDSEKEKTLKMTHGFIGLKGQTIYAGIVLSANLPDSAAVIKALGVENAFNLDGGGTTAMYYGGAYKIGPGRDMPDAIVFVKK